MAQFAGAQVFVYARCLATVVRIDGEIDAANAKDLTEAVRSFARLKTPVVLDLSGLRFVSVEGFRALLAVNDELRKARVHCSVVTGTAIRPLLRIVHDNGLATTESLAEAFQTIADILEARRRFLSDLPRTRTPRSQVNRSAAS